jgi:hypothetical protein
MEVLRFHLGSIYTITVCAVRPRFQSFWVFAVVVVPGSPAALTLAGGSAMHAQSCSVTACVARTCAVTAAPPVNRSRGALV